MKRLALIAGLSLMGAQAMAADLYPPIASVPRAPTTYFPVTPIYTWTGFYIGGNLGADWSKASFSDSAGSTFSSTTSTTGFLGGGQFGANYQFGPYGIVVGAEAMFDWLSNPNSTITATNGVNTATASFTNRWLTTATGKLGYGWDRVLLYGKGGFAWVSNSGSNATINGTAFGLSTNSTAWGWTGGIGVEWAFFDNWSVRAEYDFIGLQNQTFGLPVTTPPGNFANDTISMSSHNIQMVTVGVNYKLYGPGAW
jgi:outer membrane immunogenic protein